MSDSLESRVEMDWRGAQRGRKIVNKRTHPSKTLLTMGNNEIGF
jgi:hypothetical protein